MPWTAEPPLVGAWGMDPSADVGDVRYNASTITTLTYEGADLQRYSSTEGWGFVAEVLNPWETP